MRRTLTQVEIRCPACPALLLVPVEVASVNLTPARGRDGVILVRLQNQDINHECQQALPSVGGKL